MFLRSRSIPVTGDSVRSLAPAPRIRHGCRVHVAGARQLLTRWFDLGWGGDAVPGGVLAEVVEGGEGGGGGLDGVAGLGEQAADVADVAADGCRAGLVEGGDGFLREAVAVVQDGGGQLGGQGVPGVAAVAVPVAGAVAAAAVAGGFAPGGGGGGQGGGQGVEGAAGQAGDGGAGEPGQVRCGPGGGPR